MSTQIRPTLACPLVLAFAIALLFSFAALAQSTNATLDGTIKDDQGGVLPGATVTVINESNGLTRSITATVVDRVFAASSSVPFFEP